MTRFYEIEPTPENYWRSIILFGRNTASYKFALAKALIDLYSTGRSVFTLDELALPYAQHLCAHLHQQPKQTTRESSTFLEHLSQYNRGEINQIILIQQTLKHGFNYVLDAFHTVHSGVVATQFYTHQSKSGGVIELTDHLAALLERLPATTLLEETEARWRLVEEAWANNISRNLMQVEYEVSEQRLIGVQSQRRITLTSARPALNGYQKGRCFYCYRTISITESSELADVDHFFPHILKQCDNGKPIDGVANLVLACQECNRGTQGKFDRIPAIPLLERLYNRNEYLIGSHHPLRETLIAQTGNSSQKRQNYLQEAYNCATLFTGSRQKWQPVIQGVATF
jgi:5-methylcytosine-specific restriction endonuclease McrA